MDQDPRTQERIARQRIEEERLARQVLYLPKFEKKILKGVQKELYKEGVRQDTAEAAALESLSALGLVRLCLTKAGVSAELTKKGKLLFHENPKLRFPIPENTRWVVTTIISGFAALVAIGSLIIAFLSLRR